MLNYICYFQLISRIKGKKNKENREKERDLHTSGRRGYQRVEDDMVNNCDDILSDVIDISIF